MSVMRAFAIVVGSLVFACGNTVSNSDGGGDDGSTGGDGSACGGTVCTQGRTCCNNVCINADNDPLNCGTCGTKCTGATPFCDGTCKPLPQCTFEGGACGSGGSGTCCGSNCCTQGQFCCKEEGPVGGGVSCFTPTTTQPTCPQGCAPLCKSDRNIKHDFVPVSGRDVVETLGSVPMSTWSYDGERTRHMGPMAQDLHAAFGLGDTERAYDPIDAHGVAFAGIQGLYEILQEQDARIERLEKQNADLARRCAAR